MTDLGEVLYEFVRSGSYVKVSAVDVRTNTEVSIIGPASASVVTLKANALRKLEYVLAKKKGQGTR